MRFNKNKCGLQAFNAITEKEQRKCVFRKIMNNNYIVRKMISHFNNNHIY